MDQGSNGSRGVGKDVFLAIRGLVPHFNKAAHFNTPHEESQGQLRKASNCETRPQLSEEEVELLSQSTLNRDSYTCCPGSRLWFKEAG